MKAKVTVMLKSGVLDVQGEAVRHALGTLGFGGVTGVRQGKVIELELTETDRNADLVKQQAAAEGKTVEQVAADTAKKAGVRRLGQPEDVAALTVFLVSAAASHIQGAAISVDGGGTKGLF